MNLDGIMNFVYVRGCEQHVFLTGYGNCHLYLSDLTALVIIRTVMRSVFFSVDAGFVIILYRNTIWLNLR